MTTHQHLDERQQEIYLLEGEIINAWHAADHKLPRDAFVALLSGAKIACDPGRMTETEWAAADRALDRLRRVAEAMRS